MPMSVSGVSTLSSGTWKRRSSKYQKYINVFNVLLMLVSTALIFVAGLLIRYYHLPKVRTTQTYFRIHMKSPYVIFSLDFGRGTFSPPPGACWPWGCTPSW